MSLSRAALMEAAFRIGACAESLAHPESEWGAEPSVPRERGVAFNMEQIENIRRTLKEVVDLLGKETK